MTTPSQAPDRVTVHRCTSCGFLSLHRIGRHFVPDSSGAACHGRTEQLTYVKAEESAR